MNQDSKDSNAIAFHLAGFAGFVFPFGSVILPLILWLSLKKDSDFLDKHGKSALNFNLSFLLYFTILTVTLGGLFVKTLYDFFFMPNTVEINIVSHLFENFFGIASFTILGCTLLVFKCVLTIIAAVKANDGKLYEYPLTIKFIR